FIVVSTNVHGSCIDTYFTVSRFCRFVSGIFGSGEYLPAFASDEESTQEGLRYCAVAGGTDGWSHQSIADYVFDIVIARCGERPGAFCSDCLATGWQMGRGDSRNRGGDQCQCAAGVCQ